MADNNDEHMNVPKINQSASRTNASAFGSISEIEPQEGSGARPDEKGAHTYGIEVESQPQSCNQEDMKFRKGVVQAASSASQEPQMPGLERKFTPSDPA